MHDNCVVNNFAIGCSDGETLISIRKNARWKPGGRMKRRHSQALAALNHLLHADFEAATKKEMVTAETAVRAHPAVFTLIFAVKHWATALSSVCRSHAARCAEICANCDEQDPATAALRTIDLALCHFLCLPASKPSILLAGEWPEQNAVREFVLQVSGAPTEFVDGELITKPVLPRWEPKSGLARKIAGLNTIPLLAEDAAFLTVDETQQELRGLEESFRNALCDGLTTSYGEAVLASYGCVPATPPLTIPPKRRDLSNYLAGLTDRQREVMSLNLEHGMNLHQIAQHLRLHHSTVQEHYSAARARIDQTRGRDKREKRAARNTDYQYPATPHEKPRN